MPSPNIKLRDVAAAEKWQQILADLVTDPKELLQILDLDPGQLPISERVLKAFPLKVPRPFLSRIEKGNWQDPLLKQILPLNRELLQDTDSCDPDPLQEAEFNPMPGLLHKYQGRILLTVAPHCAVHCRYCFRRHFDYRGNTPDRRAWENVIDYIRQDETISEVIFSGGDPLAAGDRQLIWLTRQLEAIPHLQRLRIHTRTPIMIPQRVNAPLLDWLDSTRFKTIVVVHCNHPAEIDQSVTDSLSMLATVVDTMLNQSVLLKGINDNSKDLSRLSEMLFSSNVLPYYLHLLDPVQGVAHFDVELSRGRQLIREMQEVLPGYLVPKLVREEAGKASKTLIL
ncbi:MAG: EF-P beta-lysylation protein EpmB [Gammaproteobacteria bacterium]|nr:EF-P beta-lysylation protein EpmB [Gammaproteobacteria bacterium]